MFLPPSVAVQLKAGRESPPTRTNHNRNLWENEKLHCTFQSFVSSAHWSLMYFKLRSFSRQILSCDPQKKFLWKIHVTLHWEKKNNKKQNWREVCCPLFMFLQLGLVIVQPKKKKCRNSINKFLYCRIVEIVCCSYIHHSSCGYSHQNIFKLPYINSD